MTNTLLYRLSNCRYFAKTWVRFISSTENKLFLFYFCCFGLLSFFSLDSVPWLFIDEPCLAERSLSALRFGSAQMENSFPNSGLNHQFLDTLLIYLQAISIYFIGYNLFAIRLPSLIFFLLSVPFWYAFVYKVFASKWAALSFVVIFSIQLPVFYTSHLARAESLTLFFLPVSLLMVTSIQIRPQLCLFFIGLIGTIAFFAHPVGLIVPFVCGIIGMYEAWYCQKLSLTIGIFFLFGCMVSIGAYFYLIPWTDFVWRLTGPWAPTKLDSLHWLERFAVFLKMFLHSFLKSSYHYLLAGGMLFFCIVGIGGYQAYRQGWQKNTAWAPICIGLTASLFFLCVFGRASRLYFVHLYPWLVLLFVVSVFSLSRKQLIQRSLIITAILVGLLHLLLYTLFFKNVNYPSYEQKLQTIVPHGSSVLGRISHQLVFGTHYKYHALLDIKRFGRPVTDLATYTRQHDIDFIIHDHETNSNKTFADLHMNSFLKEHAQLIATIKDPYFGSRYLDRNGSPFYGILWFWFELENKNPTYTTSVYKMVKM